MTPGIMGLDIMTRSIIGLGIMAPDIMGLGIMAPDIMGLGIMRSGIMVPGIIRSDIMWSDIMFLISCCSICFGQIIEDVMTLLDLMTVWDTENSWREMEQLGLSILLAFAAQDDLNVSMGEWLENVGLGRVGLRREDGVGEAEEGGMGKEGLGK